jgi:hypothetical protein
MGRVYTVSVPSAQVASENEMAAATASLVDAVRSIARVTESIVNSRQP